MEWTDHSKAQVDAQLKRVQASAAFENAGRMSPLLEYLVCAATTGRGNSLNQTAIAVDVLGRDSDFDPQTDSIVRVEIGRLRAKLHEYYATDGINDDIRIELPKGRYQPILHVPPALESEPLPTQTINYCKTDDGVTLAYGVMGEGPPIIKTATWLTHLEIDIRVRTWQHYARALSHGRKLIRYDGRNMGMSERRVSNFNFEAMIHDLETVADAAGVDRFPIFGTSQGVSVAIAYAARYPERVSKLILAGGFLQGPRVANVPEALEFADAIETSIRYGWQKPESHFRQLLCRSLLPEGSEEDFRELDELQMASCDVEDIQAIVDHVHTIDVAEEAKQVRAPTLILHATNEMIPMIAARQIAATIPNSKIVELESRNHLIQAKEPAWPVMVSAMNDFLAEP